MTASITDEPANLDLTTSPARRRRDVAARFFFLSAAFTTLVVTALIIFTLVWAFDLEADNEGISATRQRIEAAGSRKLILGPGCGIPVDCPPKNLEALRRAVE